MPISILLPFHRMTSSKCNWVDSMVLLGKFEWHCCRAQEDKVSAGEWSPRYREALALVDPKMMGVLATYHGERKRVLRF